MKIRNGFVSNSSSSSFLLIGFKATQEQEKELREYFEKIDYAKDTNEAGLCLLGEVDGGPFIGVKFRVPEYETEIFNIDKILGAVETVQKAYPKAKIKAIVGTEAC
jgi:hypothetical protein